MQVQIAPKELIADLKDGRDYTVRTYVAKIKDWYEKDMRPTIEIVKPAEDETQHEESKEAATTVEEEKKH
jgi:hypothetical protein